MKILECVEARAFNELTLFSFEEVRTVFNLYEYYVSQSNIDTFIKDGMIAKKWYEEEIAKIEKYKKEYPNLIKSEDELTECDSPEYIEKAVQVQAKRKLIQLIKKHFDEETFEKYKHELYGLSTFKEETVETPHELFVSLNMHKDRIYSLLSIIGYYQRNRGYFLSPSDYYAINYEYSHQVYCINKNLGMSYRYVDIFLSNKRLKPSPSNKDAKISEDYQSNKFIDIDKFSLLTLIQPYLKHNTKEINKIIEIMMKKFRGHFGGGLAWNQVIEEVNKYISECEAKGIMKRVW